MKSRVARGCAIAALLVVAGVTTRGVLVLSAQGGDKPAAAPSYTEEQSLRGETLYTKACGPCHDDKSLAPLLQGDVFQKNWADKSVAALFDKILTTMPLQDPGSLTAQQSADLVAYILKINHFSAGQDALPTDAAALGALSLAPR